MSRWRATAWIFAESYEEAFDEAYHLNKGKSGHSVIIEEESIVYEDDEE